jgi:membrane fusion protein (multidrug efflux system)
MTTDATNSPATVPPTPTPSPVSPPAAAPGPHRPRHIRWALWFAALVGVIVVGYFAIQWFTYRHAHSMTDDAFVEAHIVNVAPEMVSGRLVRFLVDENDQVKQGQVLAEIEPIHYRDQVEQARGKLDLAEAELKRQEAGLTKLKKEVPLQIDVARETLAGARAEEARAKDALKLTTDDVDNTIEEAQAAVGVAKANSVLAKQEYRR